MKHDGRSVRAQPCEPLGRLLQLRVKTVANANGSHSQ
ncbi:hypothetical protein RB12072 [Rhodopirellula baltica SH 1]|uniref:Uncharacterized protein n=1 Tax=Rhodopirellula baltica (strain DSM 10527 / NCIMB 13988 / SH1) TaxID=243090 RepID=Q7UJ79_RHOBA|nr:hypothetical protein RB12072 [Rhodopirellula baltica SH 1]